MNDIPGLDVDVYFGSADAPTAEFHAPADVLVDEDAEDAPISVEDRDALIGVLGFDPAEINDITDKPFTGLATIEDAPLLNLPDIRQPDTFGCGACCAMSVGRYFGVGPEKLEDWYAALGTSEEDSTSPQRIYSHLAELGLRLIAASDMTIDDLKSHWLAGRPVICPIQEYGVPSKQASFDYGHFVVVIGTGHGHVFVFDPSIDNILAGDDADQAPGQSIIAADKWLTVWHDRDAEDNQYFRYGIAVEPPLAPKE